MNTSKIPETESHPISGSLLETQFDAATYVDQASALAGLSLPPSLRSGVIANFEHLLKIAQPVVEFPLPETVESAATFRP